MYESGTVASPILARQVVTMAQDKTRNCRRSLRRMPPRQPSARAVRTALLTALGAICATQLLASCQSVTTAPKSDPPAQQAQAAADVQPATVVQWQ